MLQSTANEQKLKEENDKLRALLAWGSDPCIYCGFPKEGMTHCQHGFPGCMRADDIVGIDNPWKKVLNVSTSS